MKKQLYFLFLVFSLISSKLMAFDIKAENEDGVMLYYKYTELSQVNIHSSSD